MTTMLVTGATGFVGRHVAAAYATGDFEVEHLVPLPSGLDIRRAEALREFVSDIRPDIVLHLAAQSHVPRSLSHPAETYEVNVLGTVALVEALGSTGFSGRFMYVSSGDVYGMVPDEELPVTACTQAAPRNPYAASKIAAEEFCLQWSRRTGAHVLLARPFNHIGPGQDERFAVASFARQITEIRGGARAPVIEVGDVETTRDFTDVRDVVGAYAAILRSGKVATPYLIASGRERRLRDVLVQMLEIAGVEAEIRVDESRTRRAEQRRMYADASATTKDTGWIPRIGFTKTLSDLLRELDKI